MNLIPVVFFTLLMGFSSFFIGMTPTWIHTTKDNLDLVSAFGAGLLVGALFLVVIPEGIETIYKQQQLNTTTSSTIDWESDHDEKEERTDHLEKLIGQSLLLGFAFMFVIDKISSSKDTHMSVPISLSELRNSDYSNGHRHSPSLGLIVHAFADGVALGATFVTGMI